MPRNRSEKETPGIRAAREYRDALASYIKACDAIGFNPLGLKYYEGPDDDLRALTAVVQTTRNRCENLEPNAVCPRWPRHLQHLNTYLKRYA